MMTLMMADIMKEDSGNYTCEIRSPQSSVFRNVTHYVYVRSAYRILTVTQRLYLTDVTVSLRWL